MLITINTEEQTAEVLDEDSKDWVPAYLKGYQYTASINDLITIDLEIALPILKR